MPSINEQILNEVKNLSVKLYGENGFEGDIVEIRKGILNHNQRIRKIELIMAGLIGSGVLGGGIVGALKLLTG